MFTQFFKDIFSAVSSLSLDVLLYICWGAFALLFAVTLVLTLVSGGVRRADKRPYLALVNVFAVLTGALSLLHQSVSYSLLLSAAFWCVGYLTYGLVVLASRKREKVPRPLPQQSFPAEKFVPDVTPPKSNVRTEHALSVTEKLLAKDLGRGDRQEVERIKASLGFARMKGELTPADNERLNENFNTLLKLMAKYNV